MKNRIYILSILSCITFNSCTTDSVSDLEDTQNEGAITYTTRVKAIIDNNCVRCHASVPVNGAPMSLTTYENVKDAVLNRNLIDRISRAEGSSGAMPLGGPRLTQNNIDAINEWANTNFPR
ncbi:cytochrome c [Flavobacterium sp.]|uniref:cytochrome c n=1 Tax=Flavobacterium sp. TaxID=239 RepID=UPI002FDD0807